MNNKFCIECRFELPITAKFCERCGFTFVLNQSESEIESQEIKPNIEGIENFKVSPKKRKKRGTGFIEFIILLICAFAGGAIGGFLLGPIGGVVGGIGSLILGRLVAKGIISLVFQDRYEYEEDEYKTEVKDKSNKEGIENFKVSTFSNKNKKFITTQPHISGVHVVLLCTLISFLFIFTIIFI